MRSDKKSLCVCDLSEILEMSQSAISHQLRLLKAHQLVTFEKEGKHSRYRLQDDHVLMLMDSALEHILEDVCIK